MPRKWPRRIWASSGVGAAVLLALLAGPAAADDPPYLELEAGACDRLVEHVPDDDVTYQPGVDVHGNPVVPADIDPPIVTPEVFWIPLEVDLQDRFGIPVDPTFFEGKIVIGVVRIEGSRVTYNGQDLTGPQAEALARLCRSEGRE